MGFVPPPGVVGWGAVAGTLNNANTAIAAMTTTNSHGERHPSGVVPNAGSTKKATPPLPNATPPNSPWTQAGMPKDRTRTEPDTNPSAMVTPARMRTTKASSKLGAAIAVV